MLKNSIVAVSTVGVRNEKELFMAGYREFLRRIEPSNIIDGEGLHEPKDKGVYQKMENTPCRKAFMAMFYLLDSVYSRFPYNNLGVVLSDICPFTFKGSMSADPAAWEDFCEYYEEISGAHSSEFEVGYYTALRFLRVYEEEWDFPIPYAMEEFTAEKYREYYYKQNA